LIVDPPDIYDPSFVKGVFDRCSDRYITFSLICSFGFTERWRRQCVAAMPAFGAGGARGYDLMAETGGGLAASVAALRRHRRGHCRRHLLRHASSRHRAAARPPRDDRRLQHQLRQRRRDRGHAEGAGLEVEFSKYFFGCATGIAGRKVGSAPEAGD